MNSFLIIDHEDREQSIEADYISIVHVSGGDVQLRFFNEGKLIGKISMPSDTVGTVEISVEEATL